MLEKKAEYHEEQLKKIDEVIENQVEHVETLDNFNATVARKQEDMRALQRITIDLRNELDRIKVEQLAPERIIKLDDAVLANGNGDAIRRYAAASLAGTLGIGLIAVGAPDVGPAAANVEPSRLLSYDKIMPPKRAVTMICKHDP